MTERNNKKRTIKLRNEIYVINGYIKTIYYNENLSIIQKQEILQYRINILNELRQLKREGLLKFFKR